MERTIDNCLLTIRDWAGNKARSGQEPPWAWYQYMKLIEAVDFIRQGRASVRRVGANSQESAPPPADDPTGQARALRSDTSPNQDDDSSPPLPM
jgi:hypothetical protein